MIWKLLVRKQLIHFVYKALNLFPNSLRKKNKIFRNIHKGERCFILGSGTSIKTHDLTKLENEIVFTQNYFHVHDKIHIIKPHYHCLVAKYQPKEFDNDWIQWLKSMEARLPSDTIFFVASNTRYLVDANTSLSDRTYYFDTGLNPLFMNFAHIDITRRIMNVTTVITECLTIALYMGFKEIYLVGMDLDQIYRQSSDRDNVRFYKNSPITNNKSEKSIETSNLTSGKSFFNMWLLWKQLNLLKAKAEKNNQKIINLTNGGILNVFERQVYEEVLAL